MSSATTSPAAGYTQGLIAGLEASAIAAGGKLAWAIGGINVTWHKAVECNVCLHIVRFHAHAVLGVAEDAVVCASCKPGSPPAVAHSLDFAPDGDVTSMAALRDCARLDRFYERMAAIAAVKAAEFDFVLDTEHSFPKGSNIVLEMGGVPAASP